MHRTAELPAGYTRNVGMSDSDHCGLTEEEGDRHISCITGNSAVRRTTKLASLLEYIAWPSLSHWD